MSRPHYEAGDAVIWRAVVSNYGHIYRIPAVVLSQSAKRVRIETRYNDGRPERRVSVKPKNLAPASPAPDAATGEGPAHG